MKVLLDECLPVDFRHSFPGHEVHSVEGAGLKGKKNGELLQAAEGGGYQVLLTVDQGIPRQQTMVGRKLSIILIRSRTNQMEDLLPLAAEIHKVLEFIQPGQSVLIPFSGRASRDLAKSDRPFQGVCRGHSVTEKARRYRSMQLSHCP